MTTLFDPEAVEAARLRGLTKRQRFEEFDRRNPHVYQELEVMAATMVARGRHQFGMKMLVEVLRWRFYLETNDPNSEFKINNNYAAHYARALMEAHPEWGPIFALRRCDRA